MKTTTLALALRGFGFSVEQYDGFLQVEAGDQGYVRKLLPDSLGSLIDKMPAFKQGEALLVGESIALPSVVQIDVCTTGPASTDIPYWALWKEQWKDLAIHEIRDEWLRR